MVVEETTLQDGERQHVPLNKETLGAHEVSPFDMKMPVVGDEVGSGKVRDPIKGPGNHQNQEPGVSIESQGLQASFWQSFKLSKDMGYFKEMQ